MSENCFYDHLLHRKGTFLGLGLACPTLGSGILFSMACRWGPRGTGGQKETLLLMPMQCTLARAVCVPSAVVWGVIFLSPKNVPWEGRGLPMFESAPPVIPLCFLQEPDQPSLSTEQLMSLFALIDIHTCRFF